MIRSFATGLVGAIVFLGANALAADNPPAGAAAPPAQNAPATGAPTQGAAPASTEWFPGFMQMCKQQGVADAECQKSLDEKKARVVAVCKQQNIQGEDACRTWMQQVMAERLREMREVCKENGVEGDDACRTWIERKNAEDMATFQEGCQKDGLNEDQCQQRHDEMVKQHRAEAQKFMSDCTAKGTAAADCVKQFRMAHGAPTSPPAGNAPAASPPPANAPAANAPAGNAPAGKLGGDKGTALPPPQ